MTVVNKRTHTPTANDVYIGRGSIWGNPYPIGSNGDTRGAVICKYVILMKDRLDGPDGEKWLVDLLALHGKNLVCYCSPKQCHGDVLELLIEELMDDNS